MSPASPISNSGSFDTTFNNPCLDPNVFTVSVSKTVSSITDNYSDTDKPFGFTFTVFPAWCPLTVECSGVSPDANLNCVEPTDNQAVYRFTPADYTDSTSPIAPGDYTVTYVIYFGYMFLLSAALFLLCGSVGYGSAFWFIKQIYGSIKVD